MADNDSNPPTREDIATLLDYCPETGVFRRKTTENNRYPSGSISGTTTKKGYRQIKVAGRRYYASRLAWLLVHSDWPDGQIDHINHIRDDDRIDNLRVVSSLGNNRNRSKATNNASGVTGVHWIKSRQCWRSNIMVNGRLIHLYQGKDLGKAVDARNTAEREHGFHVNHGTLISGPR